MVTALIILLKMDQINIFSVMNSYQLTEQTNTLGMIDVILMAA
jgi:hypothetical protein